MFLLTLTLYGGIPLGYFSRQLFRSVSYKSNNIHVNVCQSVCTIHASCTRYLDVSSKEMRVKQKYNDFQNWMLSVFCWSNTCKDSLLLDEIILLTNWPAGIYYIGLFQKKIHTPLMDGKVFCPPPHARISMTPKPLLSSQLDFQDQRPPSHPDFQ